MRHPIMVLDPIHTGALKLHYYPANSLQPGVSAWMILTHLALANGLSAPELNGLFWPPVLKGFPRPFDYDLNLPGWRVKHPCPPLQGAGCTLQNANGFSSGHPMVGYQSTSLRFCPECLALGIHLPIFQWAFISVCPRHRLPLLTRCRQCGQPLAYRFNADTFKLPGHCPCCFKAMLDIAAVDRPNRQTQKIFLGLLDFTRSLQQSLKQCHDASNLNGLTSWFKVFPAHYPAHPLRHKQTQAWLRATPGFYRPHCATAIADMHRCYRSIRRGLWRRLNRTERQQLGYWRQSHQESETQPVPLPLNRRQTTYLSWRMLWEGRSKPGSLFQRTEAPYTGLWVWRLFNLPSEAYENEAGTAAIQPEELQAFTEALCHTYRQCESLASRKTADGQFCFDCHWIGIPSNFLPASPFFQVRTR